MNNLVTVTAGCVKRKERTCCINILIWKYTILILVIYKKHLNVNQGVHNCSEKISYLFKFIQFSRRRYIHYKWVNWCNCAMLPWEKKVLIFLHQKLLGLAVMGKYHSKLPMLLNLAFLMKCKYIVLFKTPLCLHHINPWSPEILLLRDFTNNNHYRLLYM